MKTKNISWLNGDVLYAEQLQENNVCMENFIVNNLHIGIRSLTIDETALANKTIHIQKIEITFPDRTYVNYNDTMYNLEYSLTNLENQVSEGKKFYIGVKDSYATNRNSSLQSGEIVNFKYEEPKLIISTEMLENYVPFMELKINNGLFIKTEFLGPRLKVEPFVNDKPNSIFEKLKLLNVFLRNILNTMRDREYLDKDPLIYTNNILLIQQLFNSIGLLQVFISNPGSTKELYNVLYNIVGCLGWKHLSTFPLVIPFDDSDWVAICGRLVSIIYESVNGNDINHSSYHFDFLGEFFKVNVTDMGDEDPVIIIDPNTTDVREWIENTQIGSEQYMDDIIERRIRGIKREVIEASRDLLIIKLDRASPFFCKNSNLLVRNTSKDLKINSLSLSLNLVKQTS